MIEENSKFLGRSCAECITYMWDDKEMVNGRKNPNFNKPDINRVTGELWRRPLGTIPPCYECPKIPDDKPKSYYHAIEVSDRSFAMLKYFEECDAVQQWPKNKEGEVDPIIRRFATIIKRYKDNGKERRSNELLIMLIKTLTSR